jgi:hypothetical protein
MGFFFPLTPRRGGAANKLEPPRLFLQVAHAPQTAVLQLAIQ